MNNFGMPGVPGRPTEMDMLLFKSDLEIRKKIECERVETEAAVERAKKKADVAARKELQRIMLNVNKNGDLQIIKELFEGEHRQTMPFRINASIIWRTRIAEESGILFASFLKSRDEEVCVFLDMGRFLSREINRKMNAAGLRFGLSHMKEVQMRELLFERLREDAVVEYVPTKRGWYRRPDGQLRFAFPEDTVWKELKAYARA